MLILFLPFSHVCPLSLISSPLSLISYTILLFLSFSHPHFLPPFSLCTLFFILPSPRPSGLTSSTPGYWSTSCRLSGEVTIMRWRRCAVSCRTSRRRTTVSSSSWHRTSSCLQRPESKPACNTRSPGSPTRTWYAGTHTQICAGYRRIVALFLQLRVNFIVKRSNKGF